VNKITELHNKKYEEQDKKLEDEREARIARHNEIRLNRIARRNEKS
jgi:predicted secreted Zn-dependent protease